MAMLHPEIAAVTDRVIERSKARRQAYLELIRRERESGADRPKLGCANLAHAYAGTDEQRDLMTPGNRMNIGIVTSYNDMLSAHATYYRYPEQMKVWALEAGATAQVAGGVPAMCDGVTQGYEGMELSLFSRDTIALSTAVSLSHRVFEGAALLGICDKIVPGLLMGALRFGHLPMVMIPGGPMRSGVANKEKAAVRERYAEGKATREELLASEIAAYHGKGTCTFYGTANSNQMMMEAMGLHMPGAAFANPQTKLRQELTRAAVHRLSEIGWNGEDYRPIGHVVDEKSIVNAAIVLLATGGSTNHLIHVPAFARAAGILIDWDDFDRLSRTIPLLTRVYPNGSADVNMFEDAGGPPFVIKELLRGGLMHADTLTVAAGGMQAYSRKPHMDQDELVWRDLPAKSDDETIVRTFEAPFSAEGGFRILKGNIGRACIKVSAVDRDRWIIEAPARVFTDQNAVQEAFKAGELDRDVIVVMRFQGPRANGMPELHKLTPPLGVLQNRGFRVALVTDGRMSGASGKVPCAIHLSPEALGGGPIAKVRDGDIIRLDAQAGTLEALVDAAEWDARPHTEAPPVPQGTGRELFAMMRHHASAAEEGASAMLAEAGL
ncbi:phosphogluconate dehydratase [Sphingomonas xinjiangensis]|uniref:Phosphogluconate dehydratase n=1 Tax=Sphingomonas xinjiangensis TaxID=643568 RepID=A0A840YQ67_9SPHN|nr:phosphogluconate dehydratase [Sphingomonas xinjiangensis]MBB5710861.1 phosphogluconate dehydratase [Sphingomonas xinjiangensis]